MQKEGNKIFFKHSLLISDIKCKVCSFFLLFPWEASIEEEASSFVDKVSCFKCNSAQHFLCDCTGSRNNIKTVIDSNQVNFSLFNEDTHYQNVINDSNIKMPKLVRDTLGMAVLDSGCSWAVATKLWFDIFFVMLNDQDKCLVKIAKSHWTFCFGEVMEVKAINSVKFPVTIWGVKAVKAYIEANIEKKRIELYY